MLFKVLRILSVFIMIGLNIQGFGQKLTSGNIYGNVVDSQTNKPLAFSTIQLIHIRDSVFYTGTISDTIGYFIFSNIKSDSFYLVFSYVGYDRKILKINSIDSRNINIGPVLLKQNPNELTEITIVGNPHYIMHVDRSIYRPDSTDLANSVTSLDLFQRIPELKVDKSSKSVSIIGKPTMILLNGNMHPDFELITINPHDVERVEVIYNPSSRYSTEFEGVINIVLKKQLTKGYTALVSLDYLMDKKNEAGIMLQYATAKARFFGNYYFNYWGIPLRNSTDRTQYENSILTSYKSKYILNNKREYGQTGKFGSDYHPNNRTYINFLGQLNSFKRDDVADFFSEQKSSNAAVHLLNSKQNTKGFFLLQNYSLYLKREIDPQGKQLSSGVNLFLMSSDNETHYKDLNVRTDTNTVQRSQMDIGYKYSVNYHLDYIYPFSDKSRFESGLQFYYQDFRNRIKRDGLALHDFKYIEYKPALYLDYYTEIKNFDIKIGIRHENSRRNVSDSLFSSSGLLPAFRLSRKFGDHIFSLNYNKRSYYPSIWLLSPEVTMIDSLNYSCGNPYLSAQLNNAYEFNHRFRKGSNVISMTVYHIDSKNVIRNVYFVNEGALVRKPFNASKRIVYGLKTTGSFHLWEDLEFQPHFDLFFDKYAYAEDLTKLFTWKVELSMEYYIPIGLNVGFDFGYTNKILQPQGYIMNVPQLNIIYIQKNLFKGYCSVMLSYQNLFQNITTSYVSDTLFTQESSLALSDSGLFIRFSCWLAKGRKIEEKKRPEYFELDIK
jgi:hypothetical protein